MNPNPVTEAELEDSTAIASPSKEELAEELMSSGLSQKQHYVQYVQAAAKLGEDMPLGEDTAKEQAGKVCRIMPFSYGYVFPV